MADQVVGDISILSRTVVPFNAVFKITGNNTVGSGNLYEAKGFYQVAAGRARVEVVSDSLTCEIIGEVSTDKTVIAYVGVVPNALTDLPASAEDILSIGGSAVTTHALITGPSKQVLRFASEVSHQIKPVPLVGILPRVVWHVKVVGGADKDITHLRVSGSLKVEGVGFVQTWFSKTK